MFNVSLWIQLLRRGENDISFLHSCHLLSESQKAMKTVTFHLLGHRGEVGFQRSRAETSQHKEKPLGPTALKNICPYNNPLIWRAALNASGGQVSLSQHQFQPRLCLPWFILPRLIKVFLSISVGGVLNFLCNIA